MSPRIAFLAGTTVGAQILLAGGVAPARAQALPSDESLIRFSRYVAVRERVIPGYEPREVRLGSLVLSPALEATSRYSDNLLALDTPRVDDASVLIQPSAQLRTDWVRRSISLSARGAIERFAKRTSEDSEAVDLSAYGIQEFGAGGRIRAIGRFRQGRESRESQDAFALTDRPILYRESAIAIGASYRFARIMVSGEAGLTRSRFVDGRLPNGTVVDQNFRDADTLRIRGRVEFAQSSALAYFVQATRDDVAYSNRVTSGPTRDSSKLQLLGGIRFELPIPVRGEVGVGYLEARYQDPGFRDFSGVAMNANVSFFPSQLTTVTFSAQRSVNDSGIASSTGYVALVGGVQVDHELLRSLILNASARIERDRFNGVDRRDRRAEFGAGADYRMSRSYTVRLRFDRLDLSSDGADRYKSFVRNRFSLGLAVRI